MRKSRWLRLASLALLFWSIGCSSSSDVLDGSVSDVESQMNGVMQEVVLPALDQLAVFSPQGGQQAQAGPPAPLQGGEDCQSFDQACASGTYQVCSAAPEGPITFLYDNCEQPGGLVDGFWTLDFSGFAGSAEFGLSIGELDLTGGVSYALEGLCLTQTLDDLAATSPEFSTFMRGTARYCLGARPEGLLDISGSGSDASFVLILDFDAAVGTLEVVSDGSLTTCTVDMETGETVCDS